MKDLCGRMLRGAIYGLLAAGLTGCGETASTAATDVDAFPFVQCKVVMAGRDVAGAIVTFHSVSAPDRRVVSAYDSENDCYRFVTSVDGQKKAGVPEGEYRVTVKPGRGARTRIPDKYGNPKSSGLAARIVAGANFLPPFELTP